MPGISRDAHRLALKLGVGSLVDVKPCHGYACACRCVACELRARPVARPAPQPWEPKRMAA